MKALEPHLRIRLCVGLVLFGLASAASGLGLFHAETYTILTNEVTGAKIRVEAAMDCTLWPACVAVRCRDLYDAMRPTARVRLPGVCQGAGLYFVDLWDGSVDSSGRRLGVRAYAPGDCRRFVKGSLYVAEGFCPQQGRILASEIQGAGPIPR